VEPFWETTPLDAMTDAQWESLCDGCGRCCLDKLKVRSGRGVVYTRIACPLLDLERGCCSDYPNRLERVPGCMKITAQSVQRMAWLPKTCAYRRLAHGQALPDWHPLITGDPRSVARAGISVVGRAISPEGAGDPWDHVARWIG
jgi:uncharacterized cysteine cluster protein YcgN (CxxCxxCC family)